MVQLKFKFKSFKTKKEIRGLERNHKIQLQIPKC